MTLCARCGERAVAFFHAADGVCEWQGCARCGERAVAFFHAADGVCECQGCARCGERKAGICAKVLGVSDTEIRRCAMKQIEIVAVDFDGTLCADRYPEIGNANYPLIELLKRLQKQGVKIILWTCRCGERLEEAVEWCASFGLCFDRVNENVKEILERYGGDSRKIYADVYIDDKAVYAKALDFAGLAEANQ